MNVQGRVTENHAIFRVTLPLRGADCFNIFRLTPIPVHINNTMVAINLSTVMLAITSHRDKYFPTNSENLNQCQLLGEQTYLCPNTQPIYQKGSDACACEISLFYNQTKRLCEFTSTGKEVWVKTTSKNQWMFAFKYPTQVTTICGDDVSQQSLMGSGFLTIKPDCILKTEFSTLLGSQTISTKMTASYTSLGTISEIAKPNQTILADNHEEYYVTKTAELEQLQKLLNTTDIKDLPRRLQVNSYHHFSIGYLTLTLVIILGIIVLMKRLPRRTVESPPKARPRVHQGHSEIEDMFVTTIH